MFVEHLWEFVTLQAKISLGHLRFIVSIVVITLNIHIEDAVVLEFHNKRMACFEQSSVDRQDTLAKHIQWNAGQHNDRSPEWN